VIGALPLWGYLRSATAMQAGLRGINAAVVGLLVAALYRPIWTSAIIDPEDFGLALIAFGLLAFWRAPPWSVVLFCALAGALLAEL
jgi:chromate transporter